MNPRRTLTIAVALVMLVLQSYVIMNHAAFWTDHPEKDSLLHFGWGFLVFLTLSDFFKWRSRDAFLAAIILAFWWEALEMASERISNWPHQDYFFFEGMLDVVWNGVGALAGVLSYALYAPKKTISYVYQPMVYLLVSLAPLLLIGTTLKIETGQSFDLLFIVWVIAASVAMALPTLLKLVSKTKILE